jgi:hypothetical protein
MNGLCIYIYGYTRVLSSGCHDVVDHTNTNRWHRFKQRNAISYFPSPLGSAGLPHGRQDDNQSWLDSHSDLSILLEHQKPNIAGHGAHGILQR